MKSPSRTRPRKRTASRRPTRRDDWFWFLGRLFSDLPREQLPDLAAELADMEPDVRFECLVTLAASQVLQADLEHLLEELEASQPAGHGPLCGDPGYVEALSKGLEGGADRARRLGASEEAAPAQPEPATPEPAPPAPVPEAPSPAAPVTPPTLGHSTDWPAPDDPAGLALAEVVIKP